MTTKNSDSAMRRDQLIAGYENVAATISELSAQKDVTAAQRAKLARLLASTKAYAHKLCKGDSGGATR